jgi:hypothetical protein
MAIQDNLFLYNNNKIIPILKIEIVKQAIKQIYKLKKKIQIMEKDSFLVYSNK